MASFPLQIMAMDRLVFEGDVEHVMAKGTEHINFRDISFIADGNKF